MTIDARLVELGLELPGPPAAPPGMTIPFSWVRVHGDRAYISGHGALDSIGAPVGPFGKVPTEVSLEAAQGSARLAMLAVFAGLRLALGNLERVDAWLMVQGSINAEPGYPKTTLVLNPASELVLEVFGPDRGAHARTAIGVAAVPLNLPLVIAATVAIR